MTKSSTPSLATIRASRGFTQARLAQALSVTSVTVSNWEAGRSSPSIKMLHSIASALGVTVNDLLASPSESTPTQNPACN